MRWSRFLVPSRLAGLLGSTSASACLRVIPSRPGGRRANTGIATRESWKCCSDRTDESKAHMPSPIPPGQVSSDCGSAASPPKSAWAGSASDRTVRENGRGYPELPLRDETEFDLSFEDMVKYGFPV